MAAIAWIFLAAQTAGTTKTPPPSTRHQPWFSGLFGGWLMFSSFFHRLQ
jgi:hypothetical protein